MVIKTVPCVFSEYRIYPGHGSSFVRKDGKLLTFINQKCASMSGQGIKPARLTWTQAWRRNNRKVQAIQTARKRKGRKATQIQKAVSGISLEDLRQRAEQSKDVRKAQREAAVREVKERKKQTARSKKAAPSSGKRKRGKN